MARRRYTRRASLMQRRTRRPKRRSFRRRRMRRRPAVSRSRILQVASRKKFDTQLGAIGIVTPPQPLTLEAGANYVLSCPTYLPPALPSTGGTRYRREQQEIFFRGVSERVLLSAVFQITWRRVCFYSYLPLTEGLPKIVTNPITGFDYNRRNLQRFFPQTGGDNEGLGDILWQGVVNIDYSEDSRPWARLDPQRVKIVSDRTMDLNPNFHNPGDNATLGKNKSAKRWHPVNKNLTYRQGEDGSDKIGWDGWVNQAPTSAGNFYILDIFSSGQGILEQPDLDAIGTFRCDSTVYWHER